MKNWQIWIDTGGTFTDCIAQPPSGSTKRIKILSSSFLRAKITTKTAANTFAFTANWSFDAALLVGFEARVIGSEYFAKIVQIDNHTLTLDRDWDVENTPDFELTSHEEAPILAARLLTQTPLGAAFPPLTMRLGTTKGTNALLERKGAKVTLFVTKGFKDLLQIGTQQRPNLFELAIPAPTLLYHEVIEIDERLAATGEVLRVLDLRNIATNTSQSAAISLLNSYLNPTHEIQLAQFLQNNGCAYVSSSAALYAGINYLKRTQTALVNAYLQPILTHYLQNIGESLQTNKSNLEQSVWVMTSAGSLVKAAAFDAKDSLLSGPAGGMVGAATIAQRLGYARCLTFDMGGTSTDTARFDGRLDLQFVTQIEDIELHNPTLAIETVAAGGGSICGFDGQKLTVGPHSAGATPGPACYGAGGPLTITDVNLLLGKIDTAQFSIPVQVAHAQRALDAIQTNIFEQTRQKIAELELLRGFEQIANEKMAEAIRRISVAKGFDPKDYPLLTFGGAGGLHGCQLADMLGISTVILPYDAGLLSAYGMGQARAERLVTRQILKPFETFENDFRAIVAELEQLAFGQLVVDSVADAEPEPSQLEIGAGYVSQTWLYLRFKGQESTLEIAWQKGQPWHKLKTNFIEKYRAVFGYCADNIPIEVESIKLIASPKHRKIRAIRQTQTKQLVRPARFGTIQSTYGIYDWEHLQKGDSFDGPAVLLNATSTAFVPAGWQATRTASQDVIVEKKKENGILTPQKTDNQAIELALFTNRFMAIAQEMGAQLQRTAFSVNVKERLDFSCALLDAEAELLVNAPHIPVHLGSLGVCARLILEKLSLTPGDVVITNHPKYGGSHLPDVTLLSGVFTPKNELIGYVINRAHHAEIGGKTPGSMPPDATTLAEEGVVIVPTYLAKNGQMQWQTISTLFTQCSYPTRAFTENIADINAALASLKTGEMALQQLTKTHGLEKVHYYMKYLKDSTFSALQVALLPCQNQTFEATEQLDDGHQIRVKIMVNEAKKVTFDFAGTSPRHPHNLNANVSIIYSAILYVLRLLINKNIPLNEGLTRGVEVVLPENSFLHPIFSDQSTDCPAVVGGNTEVSQRLTDTLLKALQLAACSQGTMNNFLFGNDAFGYYETICGGTGAGQGFDGRSGVHQHMTNTRITDPEELERRYPVRLNEFSLRQHSGGGGQWQGGNGVVRHFTFLDTLQLTLITQHRRVPPYGLAGGQNGQTGQQTLIKTDGTTQPLAGICTLQVAAGEQLRIETPGGGGWGRNS
ncbi:MAG: 5-oxoprolinase [Cytophagia bacterium]|nr:MAG: 5-oxoprolinase [Cytophagales bacterium]TAG38340.1 MAG: 5-oxoprolinase [Cytophagia bacterium]TAG79896.1 MAG: 5-oxoprolinase [Cytophagales bacterium]